jgi:TonB family protein
MLRQLLFVFLALSAAFAGDEPKRIDDNVAGQNLIKRIDPAVPPLAKAIGLGGAVVVDVTISPEAKVSSVRVLSGHPLLVSACIEAVKRWEYKPLVMDGQVSSVIAKAECKFAAPSHTKAEEQALRDYYPAFDACYGLVQSKKASEAEKKCSEAVALSDQLPPDRIIERSMSRTFLAHSLVGEHRVNDAIPLYEKALDIYKGMEQSERDIDFASDNANLARAYSLIGEFEKADPLYDRTVTIFEDAIVNLPNMKENYRARLKRTLLEYAQLKRARGEVDNAKALEQKAGEIRSINPSLLGVLRKGTKESFDEIHS